jgi:choline dehydrogenase-like flavoprotein
MAHLRSNTTVSVPRSELGLGAPTALETGMLLVRGSVPVSGGKTHHFHLQVVAASNLNSAPDSQVFTQIPDIDLRDDVIKAQSATTIGIVLRAVGELSGDRSMTPVEGPKDTSKSWIDLTKDPNNLEFGTRRAWVNLVMNADDTAVRLAMNKAAIDLAKGIANDPTKVVIQSQGDDPLGSTHHEAGTLWMGSDSTNSLTDKDARFHNVQNTYVAGPALFPRIGSANPTRTALALARNTASVIANAL